MVGHFGQERVSQLVRRADQLQQQSGASARERALVDQHLDNVLKIFKDSFECRQVAVPQAGPLVPTLVLSTPSRRALTTAAFSIRVKPLLEPLRAPPRPR